MNTDFEVTAKDQASLYTKLAKVMGSLTRIPKSGHNTHFNYDFVTDTDVSDAIRKALAKEGIAFFASMREVQRDEKKVTAHFVFTFADGETGATWSCEWNGEAIDTQDKGIAKAATSALKYFLLKTFILSTGDPTDDSDASNGKEDQKPKPKKPAKPVITTKRKQLIARITELNGKLKEPGELDPTWFDEATEAELTAYGMQLRERVDAEAE